jgi:Tol biopolymer transport system component
MLLALGTRLGPYEILGLIGAGGMGEVYRARDPRLHRNVAIKVLASAPSVEGLRQFEQEARAAAALNHPNILVIYDVGTHDKQPFVVSELLEGETLRDKFGRGRIPYRRAIDYATQIVAGLAAAHAKGIVHRDLKPANLFITSDGRVKILDFGLAVFAEAAAVVDWSTAPTSQLPRALGEIAGTASYMAPEQVRGRSVDHRADIFSFGVVLYEMLAGERAFDRPSPVESMSAALNDEPVNMTALLATLPPPMQLILPRCLEKDPDDRFQSTRDLWFALTLSSDASHVSAPGHALRISRVRQLGRALVFTVVAVAALAAGVIAGIHVSRAEPPAYQQLTFRRGTVPSARFASDGHTIVFGASWDGGPPQLYATRTENPESRQLPIANAEILAISRSGEMAVLIDRAGSVYARAGGTLARLPLDGTTPREVLGGVEDADWSPDGENLAVTHIVQGKYRVEFPIGNVLYESTARVKWARVSPDATRVAFVDYVLSHDDRGAVCVIGGNGGRKTVLSDGWSSVSGLAWAPSGREIWFTAATLGAAASLYAVNLSGDVRLLARSASRMAIRDVDRQGRVLLTESSYRMRIGALDASSGSQRDLTWLDGSVVTDVSADARTILINEQAAGSGTPLYAIYVRKTDGTPAVRLGDGSSPALSLDGKWAAALLLRSRPSLVLLPTGIGQARTLNVPKLTEYHAVRWYPDGRGLLLAASEAGRSVRLWALDLSNNVPRPVSPEGFSIPSFGRPISPDGAQVATFDSNGRLWLLPLDGREPSGPIEGLGASVLPIGWTADSRSLFFFRDGTLPALVYRLSVANHHQELIATLAPPDLAGVRPPSTIVATPDGKSFFYTYVQNPSNLFLVNGLQ